MCKHNVMEIILKHNYVDNIRIRIRMILFRKYKCKCPPELSDYGNCSTCGSQESL